jgi:hypothetical protein
VTDSALIGVDLNDQVQLDLLYDVFTRYRSECDFPVHENAPHEYYVRNGAFGFLSAAVLHCMIRHLAPRTIIEVGSGSSTLAAARAMRMSGRETKLIAVEPYPNDVLRAGDILFIDSSHVVRIGGDVNFLYLEVLPRLREGVSVHIHDIFFPKNYPVEWVMRNQRFWTEQYLLQAFLTYNTQFEVLWCGSYMYAKYPERLRAAFPPPPGLGFEEDYFSSSFWMRKTG